MRRSIRVLAVGAITTLALVGAGCGDDDTTIDVPADTSTSVTPTSVTPTSATSTPVAESSTDFDKVAYCDAGLAVEKAFGKIEEFTSEAIAGVQPLVHGVLDLSPDQIADEGAILVAAIDAAAGGDFSRFEDPSFAEADDTVHAFDVETCGYTQVDVRLVDYAFEADPPTTAGLYSFEVASTGDEFHVFALGRLKDTAEGTAEDAFEAASEDTFADSFDQVGNLGIAPGGHDYQIVDLTPGSYVLFCPVPIGSNATNDFEGDGPPHFMQGMVTYFAVEA